jgi:competence protein ComEA
VKTKLQFQHLALQQTLQDHEQQTAVVQPAITLPTRAEFISPTTPAPLSLSEQGITGEEFADLARNADMAVSNELDTGEQVVPISLPVSSKRKALRILALTISAALALALFFISRSLVPGSSPPAVTQQNYSTMANLQSSDTGVTATSTGDSEGTIQVYVLGAVKHPGVYTLSADARIYQLLQAAGGPLANANMVALDLAAKLTDGQEIYILSIGETPPTNINSISPGSSSNTSSSSSTSSSSTPTPAIGQLVNINTATETAMEKDLHVSATTAKNIIAYRTAHGPYTTVDQLLQAISQAIYNRIKSLITI